MGASSEFSSSSSDVLSFLASMVCYLLGLGLGPQGWPRRPAVVPEHLACS